MGIQERKDRQRNEVRERILETAHALFASEGYEAVSMRRIASAIEYSPTTIYLHFKDKEALVRELCRRDYQMLQGEFTQIAAIPDPLQRLHALGRKYIEFGLRYPNHYKLMFMSACRDESGRRLQPDAEDLQRQGDPEHDGYAMLRQTVVQVMQQGRLDPSLDDPDLVAQVLWSCVHGLTSLQVVKADDPWVRWRPLDQIVDLLLESVIRGLGAASRPATCEQGGGA